MFRSRRLRAILGAFAATGALVATVGVGSASATPSSSSPSQAPASPTSTSNPSTATHDTHHGTQPTIKKISDSSVVGLSATGTNGAVTIILTGSGLIVNDWTTTAMVTTNCAQAFFQENGSTINSSGLLCAGSGTYSSDWSNPGPDGGFFPNNTQLCNTWLNQSGRPCETVHS
jgi:hypothetical protein